MITILHGDDITKSRQTYITLKQKTDNPISLEGDKLTITDLVQAVSGEELFATEKNIFIENLLTKKKASKELDHIFIVLQQTDQTITLWEGKDVDKRTLNKLPKATVQQFKYPTVIFSFLDAIQPGNKKKLLSQLREVTKTMEIEAVFYLLMRQIRVLLALLDETDDPIEELKRMAPWQKGKLAKQAKLFTKDHLLTLHKQLYEIDHGQKTGTLPYPLSTAIDIFLLSI